MLVENKAKIGRSSYRMARVIETHLDESGLCRRVTLEAWPRGRPVGLPYVPKDLERFQMAVQRLVLIHPRELEVPKLEDFTIAPEKVTTKDLAFTQEMPAAEDFAITQEKLAAEDITIVPEKDTPQEAEKATTLQDVEIASADDVVKVYRRDWYQTNCEFT